MSRLLIPAILITLVIGIGWFILYPGKEEDLSNWINETKEEFLPQGETLKTDFENYQFLEYEFPYQDNSNKWRLILLEVDPSDFSFHLLLNKKDNLFAISDIAQENDCQIAMNGIFFDTNFDSLGLIIENGQEINPLHTGELASGIFYIDQNKEANIVAYKEYVTENDELAFQSGPLIFYHGETEISESGQEIDSRTLIGVDEENHVYLGIVYPKVEKSLIGVSLYELSEVFKNSQEKLGFKMKAVLNLDGGSSTGLYTPDFYFAEKNLPQNVVCLKDI